jgi:hypothetical protein
MRVYLMVVVLSVSFSLPLLIVCGACVLINVSHNKVPQGEVASLQSQIRCLFANEIDTIQVFFFSRSTFVVICSFLGLYRNKYNSSLVKIQ